MGRQIFDLKEFKITFQKTQSDSSSPLWENGINPFAFTGHGDENVTVRMIPEDDGQIAFVKRGALGDSWINKNYRGMKIWYLDIAVLPQHPDEFRFKHMLERSITGDLPEWYVQVKDRNTYSGTTTKCNTWFSDNVTMIKIPSEFGYGYDADGARHFQFYMSNVTFEAGETAATLNNAPNGLN